MLVKLVFFVGAGRPLGDSDSVSQLREPESTNKERGSISGTTGRGDCVSSGRYPPSLEACRRGFMHHVVKSEQGGR